MEYHGFLDITASTCWPCMALSVHDVSSSVPGGNIQHPAAWPAQKMQRFRLAIFPLAKLSGLFSSKSLTFHVGRRKNVGGTQAAVFQNAGQVWISVDWIGVDDMDMYQRYVQMLISIKSNPGILSRIYPTLQANCDDRWPSQLYNWQSLLWKWNLCMNLFFVWGKESIVNPIFQNTNESKLPTVYHGLPTDSGV